MVVFVKNMDEPLGVKIIPYWECNFVQALSK